MTALTKDRNTKERNLAFLNLLVATGVQIHAGSLVCLNSSGYAVPGSTATGLKAIGRAEEGVDNSDGSDGDLTVKVKVGTFLYGNSSSTDEITAADIGNLCYIADDQTVAKTSASSTRSPAGYIVDVNDEGVWVTTGLGLLVSPSGALTVANNLSDLASAATARGNLGVNKINLVIPVGSLTGTGVFRTVAPISGTISKITSVTNGALATGDATLTSKIGDTEITSGAITIAQSGSAAGDVDNTTPSASNTVVAGDVISLTVGGTNSADVTAMALVEITF